MALDPATLLVTDILITLLVSASYAAVWIENRQQPALLWMVAAAFATAAGLACRVALPVVPAIVISNGLVEAGSGCLWMACRRLAGRHVWPWPWLLAAPVFLWLGLVCVPGFLNDTNLRLVAANLVSVLAFGLAAREVLRLGADSRYLKFCVAALLLIQAAEDLGWAAFNLFTGTNYGTSFTTIRGFAFVDVTTLIFSLLMAFGMIMLIKEQSEQNYRRAALVDALTGLGNRRGLDAWLARAVAEARGRGWPLALIMIDADSFKAYNDLYGHMKGDACLSAVAQALRGQLPHPDEKVFRYGGEEFVVVLPDHDMARAVAVAERLRLAVRGLRLLHGGREGGVVTISLGVAVMAPEDGPADAASLLTAADRALYRAKRQGRDRVVPDGIPAPVAGSAQPGRLRAGSSF